MILLDDIGPDDTSNDIIEQVKKIIKDLDSGMISTNDALQRIADLQQDVKFRKSMFDGSIEDQARYLSVELLIKLVIKNINLHS
jgi:hypothetical protein